MIMVKYNMTIARGMIFYHPQPAANKLRIMPVFLPFAGCRIRCLYCSQTTQTGCEQTSLENAYAALEQALEERKVNQAPSVEIGFYGGTFTALPDDWTERFIRLAAAYRLYNVVSGIRCSTRPDAVNVNSLQHLKELGLGTVELGIQSFDAAVLRTSLRGYSPDSAREACRMVHAAGLDLGIQLLPGLPGHTPEMFLEDMRSACEMGPSVMRLYPCVVFRNTGLARLYDRGEYVPWSVDVAASACAAALALAWEQKVRVIRIGIAQEAGMSEQIVAGPFHPALGSMVRGRALVPFIMQKLNALGRPPGLLMVPQSVRGEFWGYAGECKDVYAAAGLTTKHVRWWQAEKFYLR